jgi:hypothetical protein
MSLTIKRGELAATWAARCHQCGRLGIAEQAATRHGARMTFENLGWNQGTHGWCCRECRTVEIKK